MHLSLVRVVEQKLIARRIYRSVTDRSHGFRSETWSKMEIMTVEEIREERDSLRSRGFAVD